jgi:hypothetical protein
MNLCMATSCALACLQLMATPTARHRTHAADFLMLEHFVVTRRAIPGETICGMEAGFNLPFLCVRDQPLDVGLPLLLGTSRRHTLVHDGAQREPVDQSVDAEHR